MCVCGGGGGTHFSAHGAELTPALCPLNSHRPPEWLITLYTRGLMGCSIHFTESDRLCNMNMENSLGVPDVLEEKLVLLVILF